MSSQCRYRFGENKTWDTVMFEGNTTTVIEMKRAIVGQKKLDKAAGDFDLSLKDFVTGEAYIQDNYLITKNASIVVRRVPATKAKSIRILANSSTDAIIGSSTSIQQSSESSFRATPAPSALTADDVAMRALMQQPTPQAVPVAFRTTVNQPSMGALQSSFAATQAVYGGQANDANKPPPGYLCHKCSVPGHWIKFCPNMGPDQPTDVRTFRQTQHFLGLPRFFLKNVEAPVSASSSINPQSLQRPVDLAPAAVRPELHCQRCRQPYRNAVTTPCCFTNFCNECLRQTVTVDLGGSTRCPTCQHAPFLIEHCRLNTSLQNMVDKWLAEPRAMPQQTNSGGPTSTQKASGPLQTSAALQYPTQQQQNQSQPNIYQSTPTGTTLISNGSFYPEQSSTLQFSQVHTSVPYESQQFASNTCKIPDVPSLGNPIENAINSKTQPLMTLDDQTNEAFQPPRSSALPFFGGPSSFPSSSAAFIPSYGSFYTTESQPSQQQFATSRPPPGPVSTSYESGRPRFPPPQIQRRDQRRGCDGGDFRASDAILSEEEFRQQQHRLRSALEDGGVYHRKTDGELVDREKRRRSRSRSPPRRTVSSQRRRASSRSRSRSRSDLPRRHRTRSRSTEKRSSRGASAKSSSKSQAVIALSSASTPTTASIITTPSVVPFLEVSQILPAETPKIVSTNGKGDTLVKSDRYHVSGYENAEEPSALSRGTKEHRNKSDEPRKGRSSKSNRSSSSSSRR